MSESLELYYEELWTANYPKWERGEITPAVMIAGETVPVDYCLTTISIIYKQNENILPKINELLFKLTEVAPNQFRYPLNSLHITMLGCTQRQQDKLFFSKERVNKIQDICNSVLSGSGPVLFDVKGVGILGNQIYLQVYPRNNKWKEKREVLEAKLLESNETPICFANKVPIHINIMRITDPDKNQIVPLLKEICALHNKYIGSFEVINIDFLITDFVLSERNAIFLSSINL